MATPIEMLFDLWARMGRRNHVLDEGPALLRDVAMATIFAAYDWGAHWRHLVNTTKRPNAAVIWPYVTLL